MLFNSEAKNLQKLDTHKVRFSVIISRCSTKVKKVSRKKKIFFSSKISILMTSSNAKESFWHLSSFEQQISFPTQYDSFL
jgi:hypothetical protein